MEVLGREEKAGGDLESCNILLDKLGLVYNEEHCDRKLMDYSKYHKLKN